MTTKCANDTLQANILVQIENLKALAEREQTIGLAMEGQMIADVIGETFSEIVSNKKHKAAEAFEPGTLTEGELWMKFINSNVHLSTRLGPTHVPYKPRKLLDDGVVLKSEIALINKSLFSDEGSSLIGEYIDELEIYLENLKTIHCSFELHKDTYRLDDDDHEAEGVRYEEPFAY